MSHLISPTIWCLDTWTSAWASPCSSPSSPWSTGQCPGSEGPSHFSSYSGFSISKYEYMVEMIFSWYSGFSISRYMRIWMMEMPFPHTQIVFIWWDGCMSCLPFFSKSFLFLNHLNTHWTIITIFYTLNYNFSSQLGHHCRLLALVPLPQVP